MYLWERPDKLALRAVQCINILDGSKMIWFYQIWEAINKNGIEINHPRADAGCRTLREGEIRETVWREKQLECPDWVLE